MQKLLKYSFTLLFGIFFINILLFAIEYKYASYPDITDKNFITMKDRERQLECLARNIYYEAATEPFEGKVAVAQVTINRANSGLFPSDICKVVYQKNVFIDRVVCQFSWYCESTHKVKPIYAKYYQESEAVAKKVLLEGFRLDGLREAIYYHADYVNPRWRKEKIIQIGRHIFYKG